MDERELIALLPTTQKGVLLPIGDDCGEIEWGAPSLLASCDLLVDGEHFDAKLQTPEDIAFKSLRANLSDIAAMAGKPSAVLLAVAFSRELSHDFPQRFLEHFARCCEQDEVILLGGDTNFCSGPTCISVTILGQPHPLGSIKRSGARMGDDIYVTGPLGGSLKSGRHLRPPNRVELAQKIASLATINAMIDLSDGLATDLRHILKASQVGAKLNLEKIPRHSDVERIDEALADGEDFELCFTAPRESRSLLLSLGCYLIGEVNDQSEVLLLEDPSGRVEICVVRGFEHRASD